MLIYSFITDYQAFSLRYKDNTARDKNETKVGKQSANLGKNNEPIQNRLSFLIDCKSVILHHLTILSFPMVRPAWDNWWLLVALASGFASARYRKATLLLLALVVLCYQTVGTLGEWVMTGSLLAAAQDFRIGIPGMLLQVFGGWVFINRIIRR